MSNFSLFWLIWYIGCLLLDYWNIWKPQLKKLRFFCRWLYIYFKQSHWNIFTRVKGHTIIVAYIWFILITNELKFNYQSQSSSDDAQSFLLHHFQIAYKSQNMQEWLEKPSQRKRLLYVWFWFSSSSSLARSKGYPYFL